MLKKLMLISSSAFIILAKEIDTLNFLSELAANFQPANSLKADIPNYIETGKKYLQYLYSNRASEIPTGPFITLDNLNKAIEISKKSKNKVEAENTVVDIRNKFFQMQKEYLNSIISIMWALFDKAIEKKEGFSSGTIVVFDKDNKLYNFLLDYAKRVNPDLKVGGSPILPPTSLNCYAYRRRSTHFPEQQSLADYQGQFGIDVRYGDGDSLALLPANKRHILFGKLFQQGKNLSFVKWENEGVCYKEVVGHLGSLIKKTSGAGHAREIVHREDLPRNIKTQLNELLKEVKNNNKQLHQELKRKLGKYPIIKDIYPIVKNLVKDPIYRTKAQDIINIIEKKTNGVDVYDNLDVRRGSEVILQVP